MLIQILVREQIAEGLTVLKALQASDVPVDGAFWCRKPEAGYWILVIASQFVSQFGPLAGYQKLRQVVEPLGLKEFSAFEIALFSPNDPEYRRLREQVIGPQKFGIAAGTGAPRDTNFEDAWLYV